MKLRSRKPLKHSLDFQDPKDQLIEDDLGRFLWLCSKSFIVHNIADLQGEAGTPERELHVITKNTPF